MRSKQVFSFLLSSLLVFFLPSCQQAEEEKVTLTLNYPLSDQCALLDALTKKFPDIDFQTDFYKGRNPSGYILQQLVKDDASDLVISPSLPSAEVQKDALLDLSAYSFANSYQSDIWASYQNEGKIYVLPGPLGVKFFAYNKTLFTENNWAVPTTFDELVTLCQTIYQKGGITPLSLSGANNQTCFSLLTSLAHTFDAFNSLPATWLTSYSQGTGSCKEGLSDGVSALNQLIKAHAFSFDDMNLWNGSTYDNFINKRKSAILYVSNGQALLDSLITKKSNTDEFASFPFLGKENTHQLLETSALMNFGLAKRLGEKGQEKKLEAGLKVLSFLSSVEGMVAMSGNSKSTVYPLNGVTTPEISPFFQNVFFLSSQALIANPLNEYFNDVIPTIGKNLRDDIFSNISPSHLLDDLDYLHAYNLQEVNKGAYGEFSQDFSKEQTAQLMADVLDSKKLADVSLAALGERKDGVFDENGASWGKVYQGKLSENFINIPVLKDGNIITISLPGKYLKKLISLGLKITNRSQKVYFPLYVSGMKVIKDSNSKEVTSLTKDGTEVEDEKNYTLAYVTNDLFLSSLKEIAPDFTYQETNSRLDFYKVYQGYLVNNSPLSPSI
ncbi:MAG: ABC transporter substrate-binding protein [Bacilli bacterium]|jgi:ABC-type glycerol-3-phosphate transport system substrate-binding protein|nr:ABC transporter substrate-binding protein [Bacilli bacterium]